MYHRAFPRDGRHSVSYDTLVSSVARFTDTNCQLFVRDAEGLGRWYTYSELSEALHKMEEYRAEVERAARDRAGDAAERVLRNAQ